MPPQAQAAGTRTRSAARPGLAVLAAACLLAGCGGGFDLGRLDTDRSIVTGSIAKQTGQQPDSRVSDEAAIRAAVAAWSPQEAPADTVPWVNANTGSSGAIRRIADTTQDGRPCRAFSVSREAFGGTSRYRGLACLETGGAWTVTDLDQG